MRTMRRTVTHQSIGTAIAAELCEARGAPGHARRASRDRRDTVLRVGRTIGRSVAGAAALKHRGPQEAPSALLARALKGACLFAIECEAPQNPVALLWHRRLWGVAVTAAARDGCPASTARFFGKPPTTAAEADCVSVAYRSMLARVRAGCAT